MPKYAFSDLLEIMARLRSPDGCPWDREQSHASILTCLVEETYEFIEAVENEDVPNMREELGDLLLQVVFHAQMAREASHFNIDDVVQELCDKLVRRHPHVFGDVLLAGSKAVENQWEELKKVEKAGVANSEAGRPSLLDNLPSQLPPLNKAAKIQKRVARLGFDWPNEQGPLEKIREELGELEREILEGNAEGILAEMGDLLFSVINLARKLDVDPERALTRTNQKFSTRFRILEHLLLEKHPDAAEKPSLEILDRLWEEAKQRERGFSADNQVIDNKSGKEND